MSVLRFPAKDVCDVPAELERTARRIRDGEFGDAPTGFIVLITDAGFKTIDIGKPVAVYAKMGAYETAKLLAFAESI